MNMPNIQRCPFCRKDANAIGREPDRDVFVVDCKRCGEYRISGTCLALQNYGDSYTISSVLRWQSIYKIMPANIVTTNSIADLLANANIPKQIPDKIDKLIYFLGVKSRSFGFRVRIDLNDDYPITFSRNREEFESFIVYLAEAGLIYDDGDNRPLVTTATVNCRFTMSGWEKFYALEKEQQDFKQCFVAMSFNPALNVTYSDFMKPAIEAAGFIPLRIDVPEYNEKIDDRIISEIRRSAFVVADVTEHKAGVYFEAGFAMGLGKTVIWSCREDDLKSTHFDTRQYKHIDWVDNLDFKERLMNRIRATIPGAKL